VEYVRDIWECLQEINPTFRRYSQKNNIFPAIGFRELLKISGYFLNWKGGKMELNIFSGGKKIKNSKTF
jgi:hypothetical protein